MKLKEVLKQKLKEKNLTASGLAKRAGIPRQVIADWLKGSKPRNLEHLRSVSGELNITLEELIFGEAPKATSNMDLNKLLDDEWISGKFEVKLRRLKD